MHRSCDGGRSSLTIAGVSREKNADAEEQDSSSNGRGEETRSAHVDYGSNGSRIAHAAEGCARQRMLGNGQHDLSLMAGRKALPDGQLDQKKQSCGRYGSESERTDADFRRGTKIPAGWERMRTSEARERRRPHICATEGGRRTADGEMRDLTRIRSILSRARGSPRSAVGSITRATCTHARVCARTRACIAMLDLAGIAPARHPSEYSPPQYFVTSTSRPNHRPYLHPRRSVAESAAIFYTREHILHCDVGRFASLRKAQAARASAILVLRLHGGGSRARGSSSHVKERTDR